MHLFSRATFCLLIVSAFATACSTRVDGNTLDSGSRLDSGSADASTSEDGGLADAGYDARPALDEGVPLDSGATDLGSVVDSGLDAEVIFDGGSAPDFGPPPDAGSRFCGGFAGLRCPEGEFCMYSRDAICGFADGSGECAPMPIDCDDVDSPVCGCNGVTYVNECRAAMAGTSVQYTGICEEA
ncbi:MAG: hypothetical protein IPK60_04830 [Sandaracinaceae bacterium]|nr:hypothetical protein [Sandaracinaceae bacterium]